MENVMETKLQISSSRITLEKIKSSLTVKAFLIFECALKLIK